MREETISEIAVMGVGFIKCTKTKTWQEKKEVFIYRVFRPEHVG